MTTYHMTFTQYTQTNEAQQLIETLRSQGMIRRAIDIIIFTHYQDYCEVKNIKPNF